MPEGGNTSRVAYVRSSHYVPGLTSFKIREGLPTISTQGIPAAEIYREKAECRRTAVILSPPLLPRALPPQPSLLPPRASFSTLQGTVSPERSRSATPNSTP